MIEHAHYHPEDSLLSEFLSGELSMGMNLAVSAHVDGCAHCQRRAAQHQEGLSDYWYSDFQDDISLDSELDSMMGQILADPSAKEPATVFPAKTMPQSIQLHDYQVRLPRNLYSIARKGLSWKEIGTGIHQALLDVDRDTKCEFISMEPGARVPRHRHFGKEIMLVLNGSITDDWGTYKPSDFVLRHESDCHGQLTEAGCVCLFVTDAPLKFTEGLPRLLNPANWIRFGWQKIKRSLVTNRSLR